MDVLMVQEICLLLLKGSALYFIGVNSIYGLLLLVSWLKIKQFNQNEKNEPNNDLPSVSFLVPAYNEESLIVETLQTYLSLPQENKEIIIVNDGSHDQTMKLLQVMYQLKKTDDPSGRLYQSITQPNLKVVEAPHMGKAQALNFGLLFTRFDLVCTMDADTIPTSHGVEACLKAFKKDSKLVAAGGVIQVLSGQELKDNSPLKTRAQEWLTSFQRIEYLRTFVCERLGWSYIGSTVLISGAFCMLKKEAIKKIGGFSPRSITEDFDLIVRLRKAYKGSNYRFKTFPVTTCYTQVPRTLRHLSKQRMRWQMGLIQTLFQNGSLFLHPQHGILGLFAIPYFWLVEAFSPVMVFVSYLVLPFSLFFGWVNPFHAILFFSAGLLFNLMITIIGINLDDKYVSNKCTWSFSRCLLETTFLHFGYKQLNSWWRLLALMKAFGKAPSWGEKPRTELIHQNS
jgi:cellulose synthase/poly-beta-1,6-N-acetylglucosamine synthase-like glycosyltransferase